jgi:cytochrome c heme-lyase
MFYNALARKGKLDGTREDDMDNVVAMHNNMNEKTWRVVQQWEAVAGHENVKLLKFQGRPTDLSPKALFKSKVFGHPLPFDRHDWVVLREDNTTVRYVIDYYFDESRARDSPESAMPPMQDDDATPSLLVDVRPALDGPIQFYERAVAMPLARRLFQSTQFKPLPILPSANLKSQVNESVEVWQRIQAAAKMKSQGTATEVEVEKLAVSESEARKLAQKFADARSTCSPQERALNGCDELSGKGGDKDCGRASLNWTLCVAPVLCSLQHRVFQDAVRSGSDDQITSALANVTECVALQSAQHASAKSKYPQLFHETSR